MNVPSLMTAVLEDAVNRLLRLDPDTLARLGEFDDKCIGLRLAGDDSRAGGGRAASGTAADDRDLEFFLFPSAAGFRVRTTHNATPDVTLRGDVPVFARLAFGEGVTRRAGELQISGDIELGQRFQHVLKSLDIDWEGQSARFVGDVAAHQLGRAARGLRAWARSSRGYLEQDLREYLQEENRLLVRREAVDRFLGAVDTLRADADRLEQRLTRLIGGAT